MVAIDLTENCSQLSRWRTAGPEITCIIEEFEIFQNAIQTTQSKDYYYYYSFILNRLFTSHILHINNKIDYFHRL